MTPTTLEHRNATWLSAHIRSWVDAGVISSEQAEAISRFEHIDVPAPAQRLSLPAEVAAYVGSVLALMGGGAVVGSSWEDLNLVGQIAVGLAVMAVGLISGTWLVRLGESGTRRLGWFLWAVGTGGIAITAFAVGKEIWPTDDGMVAITVGVAVAFVSLALWRNTERPLQLLTAAIGFGVVLGGISELIDPPTWSTSIVLIAVGASLVAGGITATLRPQVIILGLGLVSGYIGGLVLTDLNERLGTGVALVVAIAAVVIALRERTVPILVLGVGGALIATQGLLATTFTGALSALIVTAVGVVIVVGVISYSMRKPDSSDASDHSSPTV